MKSIKIIFYVIALGLSLADDTSVSQKLFIRGVNELKNSLDENSPEFKCHLEKLGLESLDFDGDLNVEEIDELTVRRVNEAINIVNRICFADQREFKRIRGVIKVLPTNTTFLNNLDCFRAELKLYENDEPELPGYDYGDFVGKECRSIHNPAYYYKKHFDGAELKKCSFDEFMQLKFSRKVQLYGFVVPLMNPDMSESETDEYFKIFTTNFMKILNVHLECVLREFNDE
jgi:hypothetical protein